MNSLTATIEGWFGWAPTWLLSLLEFGVGIVLAMVVYSLIFAGIDRVIDQQSLFWRSLVSRTRGLVRLALLALVLALVSSVAPLTLTQSYYAQRLLVIASIGMIAWIVWIALHVWITVYLRQFSQASADPFLARKHVTQTHILQRVATFIIWITAIAIALMTFEGVRQYGISLLASAGAAGIILGLALQPVLQNLIAGIQIAVTQPVRIGDSLIVENEYGTVEDIKATYVVIRLWDLRRMVIPLSYFLEKPFQNWTRESTDLLGAFMIYLDYTIPIDTLRQQLKAIVDALPLWDKKVFALQVTDFREHTMEVRVLVSSSDSGKLFDLRCQTREKLIDLLQRDYPQSLPRFRTTIDGPSQGPVQGTTG